MAASQLAVAGTDERGDVLNDLDAAVSWLHERKAHRTQVALVGFDSAARDALCQLLLTQGDSGCHPVELVTDDDADAVHDPKAEHVVVAPPLLPQGWADDANRGDEIAFACATADAVVVVVDVPAADLGATRRRTRGVVDAAAAAGCIPFSSLLHKEPLLVVVAFACPIAHDLLGACVAAAREELAAAIRRDDAGAPSPTGTAESAAHHTVAVIGCALPSASGRAGASLARATSSFPAFPRATQPSEPAANAASAWQQQQHGAGASDDDDAHTEDVDGNGAMETGGDGLSAVASVSSSTDDESPQGKRPACPHPAAAANGACEHRRLWSAIHAMSTIHSCGAHLLAVDRANHVLREAAVFQRSVDTWRAMLLQLVLLLTITLFFDLLHAVPLPPGLAERWVAVASLREVSRFLHAPMEEVSSWVGLNTVYHRAIGIVCLQLLLGLALRILQWRQAGARWCASRWRASAEVVRSRPDITQRHLFAVQRRLEAVQAAAYKRVSAVASGGLGRGGGGEAHIVGRH